MQQSNIHLENITQKTIKMQVSSAGGLLLVSPQSFADFMADSMYQQYLDIAITDGLRAAKKTSEVFALCHQIPLQHIDITIKPTDSIHTDTLQYYTNILPSFKPKHFKIAINNDEKILPKQADRANYNMRSRFNQAAVKFKAAQAISNKDTIFTDKAQGHCGFEAKVNIQTKCEIPPNMESMYALHATLLSLFNKFIHDEMAIIAQMRLIES